MRLTSHSEEDSTPLWLWPNLLSLDAPIVAVLWQNFLAYRFSIPLRPAHSLALFLTVWAIYLGDRLLDSRKPPVQSEPARHRFYRRRAGSMTVLLILVAVADLALAMVRPMPRDGWMVVGGVLAYLGVVHVWKRGLAKEIAACALFTAGTFVAAWSALPCPQLARAASAFFVLCLANIVAIESWERREPAEVSLRWLERSYWIWVSAVVVVCLFEGRDEWYASIAISAGACAALVMAGRRLSAEARRVLADGVLLSPIFFLIFR